MLRPGEETVMVDLNLTEGERRGLEELVDSYLVEAADRGEIRDMLCKVAALHLVSDFLRELNCPALAAHLLEMSEEADRLLTGERRGA